MQSKFQPSVVYKNAIEMFGTFHNALCCAAKVHDALLTLTLRCSVFAAATVLHMREYAPGQSAFNPSAFCDLHLWQRGLDE